MATFYEYKCKGCGYTVNAEIFIQAASARIPASANCLTNKPN